MNRTKFLAISLHSRANVTLGIDVGTFIKILGHLLAKMELIVIKITHCIGVLIKKQQLNA